MSGAGTSSLPEDLPNDVATLKALLAQRNAEVAQQDAQLVEQRQFIAQLTRENKGLAERVALLLQRLYGRRSERLQPEQLLLFGQAMAAAVSTALPEPVAWSGDHVARRSGHGRQRLPADLPRHRIEHPVDPAQLRCPGCGGERQRIGELVSEQLEYAPASLFVLEHVRGKYACKRCEACGDAGVVTAGRSDPQPIEKGLPGPGLIAQVLVGKYADHLPLYRLERIFARHGVSLSRSTLCGWTGAAAELLRPLAGRMAERVRQSKVIHTDDTPLPVQEKGRGRTRTGRLWVYLGDAGHPYVVYDYTPTRQRDGPARWLASFRGYLQADAFGGYDGIYATGNVVEVACWAHARRKFHDARLSDPHRALQVLALIRRLYDVEQRAKELDAEQRADLRWREAVPVLDELQAWLEEHREHVLPKSPLGAAITYALNHWAALTRYPSDGNLAIDNNAAERAMRPLAIGRKNYLFAGSDRGGHAAAAIYSLIESARRHDLEPWAYLRDVLARIGPAPLSQLDRFLPDRWKREANADAMLPPHL